MMTHSIKHPENWPLLDDLHTYLWKTFPMDRFLFIGASECKFPEYGGSSYHENTGAVATTARHGGGPEFIAQVDEAVRHFQAALMAA